MALSRRGLFGFLGGAAATAADAQAGSSHAAMRPTGCDHECVPAVGLVCGGHTHLWTWTVQTSPHTQTISAHCRICGAVPTSTLV
jgi:hypothetical protein